jgi:hypothetical protein
LFWSVSPATWHINRRGHSKQAKKAHRSFFKDLARIDRRQYDLEAWMTSMTICFRVRVGALPHFKKLC